MKYTITEHAIITQHGNGNVLFYNLLLRKGIVAETKAFQVLSSLLGDGTASGNLPLKFADISCFSLSDCLLDNPSGLSIVKPDMRKSSPASGFVKLLIDYSIVSDSGAYMQKAGKKKSLFDNNHVGNFHQDIGRFLMENKKGTPEEWWIYQKFNRDLEGVRNTPYRWVQNKFLDKFFPEDFKGRKVLDFGCGVGYYSNFFRSRNADVTGVDPSHLYVELARRHFPEGSKLKFLEHSFDTADDFKFLEKNSYDVIYLSDVLLYYFEPYKKMEISPSELLKILKNLLKPNGMIYVLDPHGCFHLQPWMGTSMPFLVSGEYRNRKYRVTPSLMEFSVAVEKSGLSINRIRELYSNEKSKEQNRNVTREFPLWWLFELKSR
ncbi:MAG: class I SAM-dependent methyltransferase [Victivallales bacterium]